MSEELKRCPFCGGKATIEKHDFAIKYDFAISSSTYGIKCDVCFAKTYQFFALKEEAIEAWNRRVDYKNFIL